MSSHGFLRPHPDRLNLRLDSLVLDHFVQYSPSCSRALRKIIFCLKHTFSSCTSLYWNVPYHAVFSLKNVYILWNSSGAVLSHFIVSPPCLKTYSPSTAFSPLGKKKSDTGPCPVIGGLWRLWDMMFSQEVLDNVGWVGRVLSRCNCLSTWFHDAGCLHCTTSCSQWRT
jgi:hypothetical protein